MSYKVIYADKPLHNYVDIHNVSRTVLPNRINSSKSIPNMNGSHYVGYRYAEREIVLSCSLKADNRNDLVDAMKELAYILDVQVPHRMIIDDSPNTFVWAVLEGTTETEKSFGRVSKFDLKFVCYDPYEYSMELKSTANQIQAVDDGYYDDNIQIGEGVDTEVDYETKDYIYGNEVDKTTPFVIEEEIKAPKLTNTDELPLAKKQIINFVNNGGVATYPIIKAQFYDRANFFQCTDNYGRTVLVGSPPNIDLPNKPPDPVVLNDTCTTLQGWNTVGNVLDGDVVRTIDGSLTINKNGYAITCSNYGNGGDSSEWHGGAGRKNLSREVKDFRVEVEMEHASGGTLNMISSSGNSTGGSGGSASTNADGYYTITAVPSLNLRKGRGTNYGIYLSIPTNKRVYVSDISNKWGKTTYNGKTGYIYMAHTKWYGTANTSSSSTTTTKYKTNAKINVRSGRGTKYKIYGQIPKAKIISVSSISNGWGYVSYNGMKGYVYMKNLTKETTKTIRSEIVPFADEVNSNETREDRMGRVELYGFDQNGNKLFKVLMKDTSSFYEYSEPEMYIGSHLVVSDGLSTPNAKTVTVTEDEKSVVKKVDSGRYGNWNEFDGKFIIERTTKDDKQYWNLKVQKMKNDGTVERELTSGTLSDSTYPKGALANIVIWFGKYKDDIPVDVQNICNIKVTDIELTPPFVANKPIFDIGDELIIDFEEQGVYLNGISHLEQLDIGSEFFKIPAGQSSVTCRTDTDNMSVFAEYRERWL
jgi:predicted phage tail component-like protein